MLRKALPLAVVPVAAVLAACGDARPLARGTPVATSGCTLCHGDRDRPPTAANPALPAAPPRGTQGETAISDRAVGAHQLHLSGGSLSQGIACSECHVVPTQLGHRNGTVDMAWGPLATTGNIAGIAWNGTTCSSTYCHGNFRNGNAGNAPAWTAPRANACGTCHGNATSNDPTPTTLAQGGTHPSVAAGSCGTCHTGYSATTVDVATHLNGVIEVPSLTCTSCHGTGGRASVANADPNQAAAPPADTQGSSAPSSPGVGSHLVHVNGTRSRPVLCDACHAGAVPTQPAHSNGTVTVAFGGLAAAGGASPSPYPGGGGSCSATYCHGNFAGGGGTGPTPAWTAAGTLGCGACHGNPPPLSATVHHPQNATCATCHPGYTATTVAAATHVDGTLQKPTGCTSCHGDLALTGQTLANVPVAAPGYNAGSVDSTGQSAATAPGVGAHAAHLRNTNLRSSPVACAECHQLPTSDADVSHATGAGTGGARATLTWGPLARGALDSWSGAPVSPAYAGSTSGTGGAAAGTCSSSYCHGNFRNGANAAVGWTAGAAAAACGSCHGTPPGGGHPATTACAACHGAAYSWNGSTGTVDKALHMNGVLDGGGEPTVGGSSCGGCHGTIFAGMTAVGPGAKLTKHYLGGGDNPIDPGGSWTSPLKSAAIYASASCVNTCHGDHPHDIGGATTHEWNVHLDANARSVTRSSATRDDADFDGTQANGGLCLSCHQSPVDAGHPAVSRAAFDASAHDYVSNTVGATTYSWDYLLHDGGVFRRNCTKCHASRAEGTTPGAATFQAAHSSDDKSLLAGATNPAGSAAGFVCYNCHGGTANPAAGAQGNRSGKDIQTQIAKARSHPAVADSVHDSASELAASTFGAGLGAGVARHASCLDCHDPHQARAGTHAATTNVAGPPLEGAWGAQLSSNPAFWTAPAAGNFTKKVIAAGTDLEATLCFKCHSSYYGTLPASPSGGFTETDTAREFNPGNVGNYQGGSSANWQTNETAGGFHPVLASAASNLGATGNVVAPWSRTSLMTCSDCHASNSTADPNGPHGSTAGFILRGPNTTWNASVTALANNAWMPAGTFCLNCHGNLDTNGRYPEHSRSDHSRPCFNCHAAIPHGGPRPGMLNAGAGAAAGVGGSIPGWDGVAPYWQGGATNRLYIASYPTNNTTPWNQNNCGCNGTGH